MADTHTPPDGEVWQLMVHPAATDGLVRFLAARGLDLVRYPGDLPTYALTPRPTIEPAEGEQ